MDIYKDLGIQKYINAHDTYTVYGGSRMSESALIAMRQIAAHFVNFEELERKAGQKIAQMTGNDAAFITNGAAGALATAAAVCMCGDSQYRYSKLPEIVSGTKDEIILFRCQHNAYDKAIESTGAKLIMIGDADETLAYDLAGSIHENTAAVFYFASTLYSGASMSLKETAETAHRYHVPVVVDAAAQLPPASNFTAYKEQGADLVIFSGGKTLCGPQDSGLILGSSELIECCIKYGAPNHGILRHCKVSREAIAGLYVALKEFLEKDPKEEYQRLINIDETIQKHLNALDGVATKIVLEGPVGQDYPRVFAYFDIPGKAEMLHAYMRKHFVYTGCEAKKNAFYISPLNLNNEEVSVVCELINAFENDCNNR